jgi:arabinofuranosyltransferase
MLPTWPALAALLGVSVLLLLHADEYRSFLSDDALISFRYARRLVEGFGLTWTGSERVEGYTDLLWVLLTAAGGRLGFDYINTAVVLDRVGMLLALAVIGLSPRTARWSVPRLLAGGGMLAASIPMAVWANGGLEHGFMTGVLALALFLLARWSEAPARRRAWWAGLPFAALTLLRADGIVLVFFALLGALAVELPRGWRRAVVTLFPAGVPPLAALIGQLIFRRLYYGQWQPNTAAAKLALNSDRLALGLKYLHDGYAAMIVALGLAVAATVWLVRRRARASLVVCWTVTAGWSVYLAVVGGDIFPGWRQLIFVLVPISLLIAELAERLTAEHHRLAPLLALALVGAGALHLNIQRGDSENLRAMHELWEWDGFGIGTLLKQAFGARQPLHAVDAAGALPYWSELPTLDMLGLNDAYLAHHPPPGFGRGAIGHELGDGAYVFDRRPDLISFDNAGGFHQPNFLSGRQLLAMPEFHRLYQWVRVQAGVGNQAFAEIWVRREEGRLGVRRSPGRVEVPGYFLTGQDSESAARLDGQGKLTARPTWQQPGSIPSLSIPAGRWRVTVTPPDPDLTLAFRCGARSMQREAGAGAVLQLDQPSAIAVGVAPSAARAAPAAAVELITFIAEQESPPTLRCARPGERLTTRLAEISPPKSENLYWAHPTNLVTGLEGLSATVERPQSPKFVEISVDNNDVYELALVRHGRTLWTGRVSPRQNGGGLAVTRLDLPAGTHVEAGDQLMVTPSGGDGAFSVGHLRLGE